MAPPQKKQARANQTPLTPAQAARQNDALTDFQARRLQRRLDDLERTNPTDIPVSSFVPSTSTADPKSSLSLAGMHGLMLPPGALAGDKGKKKQTGNVRKILYAKKSLKDWLEELPANPTPPYLTSTSPPPLTPARKLCSSCGYIGAYKCSRCGEWSCDRECMGVHERDGGCGVGG